MEAPHELIASKLKPTSTGPSINGVVAPVVLCAIVGALLPALEDQSWLSASWKPNFLRTLFPAAVLLLLLHSFLSVCPGRIIGHNWSNS